MKKYFRKMTLNFVKKLLVKTLNKESVKESIITSLNEKIDFPKLTERQEKKIIKSVYEALLAIVEEYADPKDK